MGIKKTCTRRALLLVLALLAIRPLSVAGSYGDASETVPVNRLTAGLQTVIYTRPGVTGGASLGIGLAEWMSMHLEAGYGTTDIATNSFTGRLLFKLFITKYFGGVDQLSLLLGGGYNGTPTVHAALLLSTAQKYFDLYTGLDSVFPVGRKGQNPVMQFLLGVKVKNFLELGRFRPAGIFEIGVPLTNDTSFTFALSAQMFMDFKILKGRP